MGNLTFEQNVLKEHVGLGALPGYVLVVFERFDGGEIFFNLVHPGERFSSKFKLPFWDPSRKYFAVAVNQSMLSYSFDEPVRLDDGIHQVHLSFHLKYRAADPRRVAELRRQDPLGQLRNEIRHVIGRSCAQRKWGMVRDHFRELEMVVVSGERAGLHQYAARLGLEIISIELDRRLPEDLALAIRNAEVEKEKFKIEREVSHVKKRISRMAREQELEELEHQYLLRERHLNKQIELQEKEDAVHRAEQYRLLRESRTRAIEQALNNVSNGINSPEELREAVEIAQQINITIQSDGSPSSQFKELPSTSSRHLPAPVEDNLGRRILQHFYAEMDEEVIQNRVTTVEVIISHEEIRRVTGATAKTGRAEVEPEKNLIVQAVPILNFKTVGESLVEIPIPDVGAPKTVHFDVRPTHLGEGEMWVAIRQGQNPLCTLALKPYIVKTKSSTPRRVSDMRSAPQVLTSLAEPPHLLRIFEQRNGNEISYLYELQSRSLDELATYHSSAFKCDRQKYIESLYKQIERRWLNNIDDVTAFFAELRAFGSKLFTELFPMELQKVLWEHRSEIKSIMVISTEPFIPWELIHLKQPHVSGLPEDALFLGQMGLVRWLHNAGMFPDQIRLRKGRACYVIPKYPDPRLQLPEAELEADFLKNTFDAVPVEPQPDAIRTLISKPGNFDLLHFSCHGEATQDDISNAELLLEGRNEKGRYAPATLSATTVEMYCNLKAEDNRPMVVLNACQVGREGYGLTSIGGFAQAFLKGGAGVFIGALWSVGDSPARTFTETFYEQFSNGADISEATIRAREEARQAGDATWLAYVVYGHPYLKVVNQPSNIVSLNPIDLPVTAEDPLNSLLNRIVMEINQWHCPYAQKQACLSAILHVVAEILLDDRADENMLQQYADELSELSEGLQASLTPIQTRFLEEFIRYEHLQNYLS